jgi:hypothetical protein
MGILRPGGDYLAPGKNEYILFKDVIYAKFHIFLQNLIF